MAKKLPPAPSKSQPKPSRGGNVTAGYDKVQVPGGKAKTSKPTALPAKLPPR